jgi:hypothetical protein
MSTLPARIQRRRTAGWRLVDATSNPNGAKIVDRTTRWGNPFRVGVDADDRAHATALFREWLEHDSAAALDPYGSAKYRQEMSDLREWMLARAAELAGLDLACPCDPPEPGEPDHCHAAVLLKLSNSAGVAR